MYLNLKTEMARNNISIEQIAIVLNIHRNSVSNKLKGESRFTIEEAFILREILFPYADLQYLFKNINKN